MSHDPLCPKHGQVGAGIRLGSFTYCPHDGCAHRLTGAEPRVSDNFEAERLVAMVLARQPGRRATRRDIERAVRTWSPDLPDGARAVRRALESLELDDVLVRSVKGVYVLTESGRRRRDDDPVVVSFEDRPAAPQLGRDGTARTIAVLRRCSSFVERGPSYAEAGPRVRVSDLWRLFLLPGESASPPRPRLLDREVVRAARAVVPWRCESCPATIAAGDRYALIWSGRWKLHVCVECARRADAQAPLGRVMRSLFSAA